MNPLLSFLKEIIVNSASIIKSPVVELEKYYLALESAMSSLWI